MEENINQYKKYYYGAILRGILSPLLFIILCIPLISIHSNIPKENGELMFLILALLTALLFMYNVKLLITDRNFIINLIFKKHVKFKGMYFFWSSNSTWLTIYDLFGEEYNIEGIDTIEREKIYDLVILPYLRKKGNDIKWL